MNKIYKLLFLFIAFSFFIIDVNAIDYSTKKLINLDTEATVKTDTFLYDTISYVNDNNNSYFNIKSVVNNTNISRYVSINILLFDSSKKNIGFLTYCSEYDYNNSVYSQKKLKSSEGTDFIIKINDKYFVDGYSSKDIGYYSVLDENSYCHIGGYDKYKGLTLEQIIDGKVNSEKTNFIQELLYKFDNLNYNLLFTYILVLIISCIITGIILNLLNKKMHGSISPVAFIPIGNNYLSVKLAFGRVIASIYTVCLFVSFILYVFDIKFVLYIVLSISSISFIIDLFKLISKKYNLFIYEPTTNNHMDSNDINYNNNFDINNTSLKKDVDTNNNDNNSSSSSFFIHNDSDKGNEIIDLNYSDPNPEGNEIIDLNYSNPSSEGMLPLNDSVNPRVNDNKSEDTKDDKGETDLSKLFR